MPFLHLGGDLFIKVQGRVFIDFSEPVGFTEDGLLLASAAFGGLPEKTRLGASRNPTRKTDWLKDNEHI